MIAITVQDNASGYLRQLIQQAGTAPGLFVAGRAVANTLRNHYGELDRTRVNKWGGKRTHFWARVRSSVQAPRVNGSQAVVSINHVGLGQKVSGGVIRPVRKQWLTIPAAAEAYGKTAREFNNLHFEVLSGKPALVTNASSGISYNKRTGKIKQTSSEGGKVMFWLRKRVTQQPDPQALPPQADLNAAAVAGIESYIRAHEARNKA